METIRSEANQVKKKIEIDLCAAGDEWRVEVWNQLHCWCWSTRVEILENLIFGQKEKRRLGVGTVCEVSGPRGN